LLSGQLSFGEGPPVPTTSAPHAIRIESPRTLFQILAIPALAATLIAAITLGAPSRAEAVQSPVNLGTAESYSVLGGQTVTNTGPTILPADLGVYPGTSITGFPPGIAQGAVHVADAAAQQAQSDVVSATTTFTAGLPPKPSPVT
jgi:hypothetical protein